MTDTFRIAIVGTGSFAHNLAKVFTGAGCRISYFIDEEKSGQYLNTPIIAADQLNAERTSGISKFIIGISMERYRKAAIERLNKAGVPNSKIFTINDDPSIPILTLIFNQHRNKAIRHLSHESCRNVSDLDQHIFGANWYEQIQRLDSNKKTLAFCCYGRGGGFKQHLSGLIPRLGNRFNLLALADEQVEESTLPIPVLYMSPDSATRFQQMDLGITAHFIECSPQSKPKLNFLHTSFDFILEPRWIQDRFNTAEPHYIVASTRATYDWICELANNQTLSVPVCVIPGGYTRLDSNLIHANNFNGVADALIYAPTLSLNAVGDYELTYSAPHGKRILEALLQNFPTKRIIFRPHPNDLALIEAGRNDLMAQPFIEMLALCEQNPRCLLDGKKTFYMDSYNASSVMISDTSSTAYTYALSTTRPVVFYSPNDGEVTSRFSKHSAFIRDRLQIGKIATNTDQLIQQVAEMLHNQDSWKTRISRYRDQVCFNLGRSEQYIVDNLDYILESKRHPDWRYFNWPEE